ncbi:kinase [Streptomyces sp. NPDC004539]|uniref:GHMP family kinase ATP-binding protein n=1 Tax=Streptomyces sp. NPDC004539 TaxID=3154280 RepID=UPI0033A30D93
MDGRAGAGTGGGAGADAGVGAGARADGSARAGAEARAEARAGARGGAGVGVANGTFGELLQGVLPDDDRDFLVTFPITRSSRAEFRPLPALRDVIVQPPHKTKSRRLAEHVLGALGRPGGGLLRITTTLPEGKGLASSSADLVATARAVGETYGIRFTGREIEAFLRDIEPSDGVMYPGIVTFYHREVRLRERLGFLPPLTIVAHDTGGTVDTVLFNRTKRARSTTDKREYARLLRELTAAVRDGDLRTVGAIATRSAQMHAPHAPREHFDDLLDICRDAGGLGLVLAHSGTNLGVLLAGDGAEHIDRVAHVRKACAALTGSVSVYRSLGPEPEPDGDDGPRRPEAPVTTTSAGHHPGT